MEKAMSSRWRKAKLALGMNFCVYVPKTLDDHNSDACEASGRPSSSGAPVSTTSEQASEDPPALMPTTPIPTSSGLRLPKSGSSRASKKICAICLATMKPGHGHALFTAECSHTFHFHCIVSNVKHGNQVCPVCRSKWKEIPLQGPENANDGSNGRAAAVNLNWLENDGYMNILRRLPRGDVSPRQQHHPVPVPLFYSSEPGTFDDDEALDPAAEGVEDSPLGRLETVQVKVYPEFSAVPRSASPDNFAVLVHLKAPLTPRATPSAGNMQENANAPTPEASRAPVDLVTVLDVSGSMGGTKLALLKRAMGFVIQNLGPSDRLSVIAFSSTARRLFPLRRMSEAGRQEALQAVNSLSSGGGTNIAEGLRKGAKVIEHRREKNPVCSVILLSDGQDTYTLAPTTAVNGRRHQSQPDHRSLLVPSSIQIGSAHHVPVHVFGFGSDHDSESMHSISETSGGTFSFIEAEAAIQDAFAQCIGGLLSVVVQELQVGLECMHPGVKLSCIRSGSYSCQIAENGRSGSVDVGDLYADEERDFLLSVNVPSAAPPAQEKSQTTLLGVRCVYKDPISKEKVCLELVDVSVSRPASAAAQSVSIQVDRQRNRVEAAEAMAKSRQAAELGDLAEAVRILEECREMLTRSPASRSGDQLSTTLEAELKEMQERMTSRQRYEESGRAYMLSGLSSHSWQRATTRGGSTDGGGSHVHQAYQTQSMVDMLQRSQTFGPALGHRSNQRMRHTKSFPVRAQPS